MNYPNNRFKTIPSRELPIADSKFISINLIKTRDDGECMILKVANQDYQQFDVFAHDRLKANLTINSYNFLRNLGFKTSKSTRNQCFDYRLANQRYQTLSIYMDLIIEATKDVYNILGYGLSESTYQKALSIKLKEKFSTC